jgi:hypothetical protein
MERNMPPWADIDKNHKLDYFFNAYVYGTEIPKYTVTYDFSKKGEDTMLHFKVVQSGVSDQFEMLVPVYLEFENGKVMEIGRGKIAGPGTIEQTIDMGKPAVAPKKVSVNYNFDLLAD